MIYNSTTLLPLISNLPITQQEKLMYSQLYGMNYQMQNQRKPQIYQQQQQVPYTALQYGYHSQFIPAYQNLPLIQSQQISPLPLNYNIGSMVHQPGTQIRLGFDLSDFGIPNDPIQIRKPFVKKQVPKKLYPQIPDDYLERVEFPRIQLQEEEQYRIIYQKKKQNQQQQQQYQQYESDSYQTKYNQQPILSKNQSNLPTNQVSSNRTKQQTNFQETPKLSEIKPKLVPLKKRIDWRKKTKILRINLIFLALYLKTIKLIVNRKKELILSELKKHMSPALNQLLDWLDLRIDDCLHDLLNNTLDFQLVLGQDKVNAQKKKAIQDFLSTMIGKVVKNFKFDELFKDSLLKVMSILIKSYSFPPFQYFSKFEAQRLPLTKFGSYSLMSQQHQKMVLLIFLFIRSIIFSNLFKVWQFYPNQENQAQILLIKKNSIILSSILHDIIIKWVSKTLPIKEKDLNELKKQVDFNEYPLSDNLEELKKLNKTFPDYMLIEGLLSQTILLKYTHNENNVRLEWIDKLEKQIMDFCDLILEEFNRYHRENNIMKERLIQQMIKIDQEQRFKSRKRK